MLSDSADDADCNGGDYRFSNGINRRKRLRKLSAPLHENGKLKSCDSSDEEMSSHKVSIGRQDSHHRLAATHNRRHRHRGIRDATAPIQPSNIGSGGLLNFDICTAFTATTRRTVAVFNLLSDATATVTNIAAAGKSAAFSLVKFTMIYSMMMVDTLDNVIDRYVNVDGDDSVSKACVCKPTFSLYEEDVIPEPAEEEIVTCMDRFELMHDKLSRMIRQSPKSRVITHIFQQMGRDILHLIYFLILQLTSLLQSMQRFAFAAIISLIYYAFNIAIVSTLFILLTIESFAFFLLKLLLHGCIPVLSSSLMQSAPRPLRASIDRLRYFCESLIETSNVREMLTRVFVARQ